MCGYFCIGRIHFMLKGKSLLTVCYYHVTYAFQSEFTLYSFLNVKKLLARNRRDITNSLLLRWYRAQDLFGSQIPVTTGEFERRISCIRSSYLA